MDIFKKATTAVPALLLLLFCTSIVHAQDKIRVIERKAMIYTKPKVDTSKAINAEKGDIFEIATEENEWIKIHLFTGADRYIERSLVEKLYVNGEIPPYPSDPSKRNKVCNQVTKAQSKASRKAYSKYGDESEQQAAYEKFLLDKYLLKDFQDLGIPPAHYSKLVECVNNGMPRMIKVN